MTFRPQVLPICLLRVVDMGAVLGPKLHVAALCIYWCQYSFNFFIYALRCHQYRKAYLDFIKIVGRKSIGMVTRKDDEKSASFWIKAEYLFFNLTDDLIIKRILGNEISYANYDQSNFNRLLRNNNRNKIKTMRGNFVKKL